MKEIGPQETLALLEQQPDAVIIDVREPWELEIARYPIEVLHIPMDDIQGRLAELAPERPTVVACRSGGRSRTVAGYLERNGFEQVFNLAGGILAWGRDLDPSITEY